MTGSEDLSETRNLVEEINMRTKQLPLTKQDSYANAIYNSATRAQQARKGIKKQGTFFFLNDLFLYLAIDTVFHPSGIFLNDC